MATVRSIPAHRQVVSAERQNTEVRRRVAGYARVSTDKDGLPVINEKEAATVQLIYRLFMDGKTFSAIASHLTQAGIPTPAGKKVWQSAVVRSILTQEKYKGHALLQKRFCENFLTKKMVKNTGQVEQFYVEDSHPAIIEPDEWDAIQLEIERRTGLGHPLSCSSPFSTRIFCADCGGMYGKKVWGSYKNDKSRRREVWQCNNKYARGDKPGKGCKTPTLYENDIKIAFLKAFNCLMESRDNLIADCRLAQNILCDTSEIDAELASLNEEYAVVKELSKKAIKDNASRLQDQTVFKKKTGDYLEKLKAANERISDLETKKRERISKYRLLDAFIRNISDRPLTLDVFDERLWLAIIDRVMVSRKGKLTFVFRNGTEITA